MDDERTNEGNAFSERAEGRETLFARLRSVSSNQGGSKAGRNQFLRKKMSTGCSPSRGVVGSLLPLLPLLLFSSVGTRSPQSIAERELRRVVLIYGNRPADLRISNSRLRGSMPMRHRGCAIACVHVTWMDLQGNSRRSGSRRSFSKKGKRKKKGTKKERKERRGERKNHWILLVRSVGDGFF